MASEAAVPLVRQEHGFLPPDTKMQSNIVSGKEYGAPRSPGADEVSVSLRALLRGTLIAVKVCHKTPQAHHAPFASPPEPEGPTGRPNRKHKAKRFSS